jgi:hypothetical protein
VKLGLAQQFLMQALAMKRKNIGKLRQRVENGCCIIDDCKSAPVSRGLCDKHRQRFYTLLRSQDGDAAKIQFEQNCIREGLILPDGEQAEWTRQDPFAKAIP